jgi:hypothetical protein
MTSDTQSEILSGRFYIDKRDGKYCVHLSSYVVVYECVFF